MIKFMKFIWTHHVMQEHKPERMIDDKVGICSCGQRIAKDRKTWEWFTI